MSGETSGVEITLSAMETVEKVVGTNPAIDAVIQGRPSSRAISVFQNTVTLEASYQNPEIAGYRLIYQNARCRVALPAGRYMTIDFDAGRVSLIDMFVPTRMLDLDAAIEAAHVVEDDLQKAGCLRRTPPPKPVTEADIRSQVGEKSAVLSVWKMCGPAGALARISVRYFGQEYIGTSVPLGGFKAVAANSKEHFLVEIAISVDDKTMQGLIKLDLRRRQQFVGSRAEAFSLQQWAAHPEWSEPDPP